MAAAANPQPRKGWPIVRLADDPAAVVITRVTNAKRGRHHKTWTPVPSDRSEGR